MTDRMDLHTHTLVSGHAYNTMREQINAAKEKGLELLAITEHGPDMPGSCKKIYFENMSILERRQQGMTVLFGAEVNILDYNGRVDLPNYTLKNMDVVIASLHLPCYKEGSKEQNTNAYLKAMENPWINIIGHPDDQRFEIDYEALVLGAKNNQVLLEVNASSLSPNSYRVGAADNYKVLLELCEKHRVSIVINSDAHTDLQIGNHDMAWEVIQKANFPEELIVNYEIERVKPFLNYYKKM